MNNINVTRTYTAIIVATLALGGFFAVKLTGNAHRTLTTEPSPLSQAVPEVKSEAARQEVDADLQSQIHTYVAQEPASTRDAVTQMYAAFSYAPLWINKRGSLKDLTQAVDRADAQGIATTELAQVVLGAQQRLSDAAVAARTDVALTREALRLTAALKSGAVPTSKLGQSWVMPAESFDPVPGLVDAIKQGDLAEFLDSLPPQDAQYRTLVAAYKTYREIAAHGGWPVIPAGEELRLDTTDDRLALLRQRLIVEGYLDTKAASDKDTLSSALRIFQARNGLEPDGRIGRGTFAALNVAAETRIAQIAANMERRRHTTRDLGDAYVAVNSASTTLELISGGKAALRMNVVAGDKRHATPILSATITGVTLNPRWEIPASIAAKEILPKLKANPRYLAENNMIIVDGVAANSTGETIDWSQYSAQSFPMRLRQRAGDDNALGMLKFQMTNPHNIYLHDTPSKKAFARTERHLSHGCVRLGEPVTLAAAVLAETGGWDADAITAEINQGETRTIALKSPLPVHIFYWTAFSEDGVLHFRNDVYNRDQPLADALGLPDLKTPVDIKTVAVK